ncbi:MAG: hypothetical protein L3J30_11495 [Marinosulfonomonas sp.]|nr:hypothetical protein [Marinosulfonomonas sp.]
MSSKRFHITSAILIGGLIGWGVSATAQEPLSAIDWLSDTVATPVVLQPPPESATSETAVTNSASVEDISVTTLDGPTPDAVGLLPVSVTGLPRGFWGETPSEELARLIRGQAPHSLPAMQDLLQMILLAELGAPADADGTGALFLARIDKLLDMGTLEQAQALLVRAGPHTPALFRRWFDVALLTGTEDAACDTLRTNADIAPTFPARIFCLARNGDWNAAAVTLETAKVLGYVTPEEDALLARFLDPELFEGTAPLPMPKQVTPLIFRMREAIGESIPTPALPRAFANADLRSNTGWKAQIEAAERLAITGAIDENQLLGIYTERLPAASGGVWERVDAVQMFDTAYSARDPGAVAKALPAVWNEMKKAQLEVPFAALYGEGLARLPLGADAAPLAYLVGLLSEDYEKVASKYSPTSPAEKFLAALAQGDLGDVVAPNGKARAIKAAFTTTATPEPFATLLEDDKLGEAILRAISLFNQGTGGNLENIRKALILLRSVGLEDTARRAALQLMLLDRRG